MSPAAIRQPIYPSPAAGLFCRTGGKTAAASRRQVRCAQLCPESQVGAQRIDTSHCLIFTLRLSIPPPRPLRRGYRLDPASDIAKKPFSRAAPASVHDPSLGRRGRRGFPLLPPPAWSGRHPFLFVEKAAPPYNGHAPQHLTLTCRTGGLNARDRPDYAVHQSQPTIQLEMRS